MCHEAKCSSCGKTTWGGCGRHVRSVYERIQQDQRCICHQWPGVDGSSSDASASNPPQTSSICTIL